MFLRSTAQAENFGLGVLARGSCLEVTIDTVQQLLRSSAVSCVADARDPLTLSMRG